MEITQVQSTEITQSSPSQKECKTLCYLQQYTQYCPFNENSRIPKAFKTKKPSYKMILIHSNTTKISKLKHNQQILFNYTLLKPET